MMSIKKSSSLPIQLYWILTRLHHSINLPSSVLYWLINPVMTSMRIRRKFVSCAWKLVLQAEWWKRDNTHTQRRRCTVSKWRRRLASRELSVCQFQMVLSWAEGDAVWLWWAKLQDVLLAISLPPKLASNSFAMATRTLLPRLQTCACVFVCIFFLLHVFIIVPDSVPSVHCKHGVRSTVQQHSSIYSLSLSPRCRSGK